MAPKLVAAAPPSPDRGLDRIDRRLLVRLQQDGRTPVSQLAREVHALRERYHVYMTDDSRMNIAGLRRENLEYFARSVAEVLGGA